MNREAGGTAIGWGRELPLWLTVWLPLGLFVLCYAIALTDAAFYATTIDTEEGILELVQAGVLAVALMVALPLLRHQPPERGGYFRPWIILLIVGCVYVLGEEISWGQHLFGWRSPDWFARVNEQGEINLHNLPIEGWLDEKPRAILEIGVIVGGIIHPAVRLMRGRGLWDQPWWLFPTAAGLASALLAEISALPWMLAKINLIPMHYQVLRASELQEFFFYVFILIYLVSLKVRFAKRRHGVLPDLP